MSGINTYKKKIDKYIKDREGQAKPTESGKGLLSPKELKQATTPQQKDTIEYVSELVYELRQKRKEIVANRSKK
jgi:hypothetical protein